VWGGVDRKRAAHTEGGVERVADLEARIGIGGGTPQLYLRLLREGREQGDFVRENAVVVNDEFQRPPVGPCCEGGTVGTTSKAFGCVNPDLQAESTLRTRTLFTIDSLRGQV
jgi:hypothetical protein